VGARPRKCMSSMNRYRSGVIRVLLQTGIVVMRINRLPVCWTLAPLTALRPLRHLTTTAK
jgi:hypothetical protein